MITQNELFYHRFVIDQLFNDMYKTMKTQSKIINIDLSHINEELNDTQCVVEYETYKGTTHGLASEDPSEVEIVSVKIANEAECPALSGQELDIDPIHKQIMEVL